MHSLTKYVNGHGDGLGGAVIGRQGSDHADARRRQHPPGATISPFNAWLVMAWSLETRSLADEADTVRTLGRACPIPGRTSQGDFIRYPGLESHPQHEIARKQMKGYSGMLNFSLKTTGLNTSDSLIGLRLSPMRYPWDTPRA